MDMDPLSPRLQAIAELITIGQSMADIGSDHARLPIYLIKKAMVPSAVASELGSGPYQRSLAAVRRCRLHDRIQVRQGDGLQPLQPGEVATVVIAGMGGDNIAAILSRDWAKADSFQKYIFQPMTKADVLRKLLAAKGWPVLQEKLLLDNDRHVLIMVSQPGRSPYPIDAITAECGAEILKADQAIKREYLFKLLEKYTKIYASLACSRQEDKQALADDCRDKIVQLEMILGESHRPGC